MEITNHQKQLAYEIAIALDDMRSLAHHEKLVGQYAESYLRETLNYVMNLPREKITNSRAAFYIWLIHNNAKPKKKHSRD